MIKLSSQLRALADDCRFGSEEQDRLADAAASAAELEDTNAELLHTVCMGAEALDNYLRGVGSSVQGFLASRRLMAKAERVARAVIAKHKP